MAENKRYFERRWEDEYYIFDSQIISEKEFDEKVEYEDYQAFADSMSGNEVVDRFNELNDENIELKNENKQLKQQIKDLRLSVLDSIHEAYEIKCNCSPCVVEECIKKVIE